MYLYIVWATCDKKKIYIQLHSEQDVNKMYSDQPVEVHKEIFTF